VGSYFRSLLVALAACLFLSGAVLPAEAQNTPDNLHEIGVDAYLYFYPLVSMEVSRRVLTNFSTATENGGPENAFTNKRSYPAADFRAVVRPNFDTLYSQAWLDLTKGPLVISAPDTNGRYYLLPMLDMWSDVFASPGWRTTGTKAGNWVVVPPGFTGTLPSGVDRIDSPTYHVWIIGRTKTDGPQDYAAVHAIQDGYRVTPLADWAKGMKPAPIVGKVDPSIDMKNSPKAQVDMMSAREFFAYAAEVMKAEPPHSTDQPIIANLRKLGFVPGQSYDLDKADPAVRQALASAPADAQKRMDVQQSKIGTLANGWSSNLNTMGVYGNYYLKRAIIARAGLGANLVEDAIYPLNVADSTGQPLNGANNYVLHFDAGKFPPARAFWSVTMYDAEGFQVANQLNRFAISSWMPLKKNADGSLDLYLQYQSPGPDRESNWLPAPKGPLGVTMRLYAPETSVLLGEYTLPPILKVK
jgi:hypothetical protein